MNSAKKQKIDPESLGPGGSGSSHGGGSSTDALVRSHHLPAMRR